MQPPSAAGQEKTRKALSRAGFLILLNPFGLVQTSPKSTIGGCRIPTKRLTICFLTKKQRNTQNCANFSPNIFLGFSWIALYTIGFIALFMGAEIHHLNASQGLKLFSYAVALNQRQQSLQLRHV